MNIFRFVQITMITTRDIAILKQNYFPETICKVVDWNIISNGKIIQTKTKDT